MNISHILTGQTLFYAGYDNLYDFIIGHKAMMSEYAYTHLKLADPTYAAMLLTLQTTYSLNYPIGWIGINFNNSAMQASLTSSLGSYARVEILGSTLPNCGRYHLEFIIHHANLSPPTMTWKYGIQDILVI